MSAPEKQEVFSSGPLKRVVLADADSVNPDTLLALWKEQDRYLNQLESKFQEESVTLRDSEVKRLRREQLLAMRLQVKEQEIQELSNQVSELKAAQVPSTTQLRSTLVDPGVNVIIRQLQKELEEARKRQQETQEELSAWKFTPDSATGKRLMSKCRQLIQENEEIGKMISGGRLAKLEGELAMQGKLCEEMKKNQLEMDEFVQELDEDVEGMQVTALSLYTDFSCNSISFLYHAPVLYPNCFSEHCLPTPTAVEGGEGKDKGARRDEGRENGGK